MLWRWVLLAFSKLVRQWSSETAVAEYLLSAESALAAFDICCIVTARIWISLVSNVLHCDGLRCLLSAVAGYAGLRNPKGSAHLSRGVDP